MILVLQENLTTKIMALEINDETKKQVSALIVDDDRVIRKIHSMILSSLKVKSEMAVNGKEAVDLFRSGANFDIVFMDLEMPIMNGIEVLFLRIKYY